METGSVFIHYYRQMQEISNEQGEGEIVIYKKCISCFTLLLMTLLSPPDPLYQNTKSKYTKECRIGTLSFV